MSETLHRLSDKIMDAHELACEEGKKDVAQLLIEALELDLSAIGGRHAVEHRQTMERIEKTFERHEALTGVS